MWQFIKEIPSAVKVGVSIASGVITGIAAAFGIMIHPIRENMAAIEANVDDIAVVESMATSNLTRLQYLDDKIDFILCNQNPEMTWQECELQYRRSEGSSQ